MARAYLRFEIGSLKGDVKRVSLLLYSRTQSRLGYQVRLATTAWREGRISYANAPRISPRFVGSGPVRARAWKAVDVTSLVGSVDDTVNLALATVAPRGIELASRESGVTGPRLVLETEESDTTGSTTTAPGGSPPSASPP